ncbi:uncharacterized protein IL334_005645 [Kwoniella shivajii]|uniref:NAD-dependent epimerase/dehydratase domain-containing protein n=1 Tax=Kwoniella shivajii TaxID=564305 RepID=A0ABZ1D3Q1_9TREE|nr:hypothetical protein IL334_005645 [Kwoniella shivajii]
MKVFITGATGWVGRHVVPELVSHGHEITAIARTDDSAAALEKQGVTVVRATLEDTDILHSSAKEADAVIHLAYIHDFTDYGGRPAKIDFAAIRAMCSALEGTDKPFIGTGGVLGLPDPQTENESASFGPRKEAEQIAFEYIEKGVRPIVIRLSPSVHGDGDKGFIPILINLAKEKGYTAYIRDQPIKWPGVHVKDAAILYRLAIENQHLNGGTILHGVAESGVPFRQIVNTIGKKLDLEVKEIDQEKEAQDYFGWMAFVLKFDGNASSEITKQKTGWVPKEKSIMEDLETGTYFN